ncbi:hypothetical protein KBX26_02825 [Micromonospora sp. C97]|uniref:hypothetical protein n=1 Tax=Micromonospora sp. C97 TaxID=2824883 RepID=UPI001B37818A|nr:hypothetical protein [Micromonospora sp. C97]MBQ1028941.1 hypothetical protein [Micromonospora sp. C97]
MTVGQWYNEAYQALRTASAAMGHSRAMSAADINAAVIARSAIYTQLARASALLVGGRPAAEAPDRARATAILARRGQGLTQLYVGLQGAAVLDRSYPPSPAAVVAGPARSLRRAADAIGVIGDILASHVPPGQTPRTPEGLAIRAGGGVQSGLADIARLTSAAIMIDIALPGWLDQRRGHLTEIYRPATEAARWTASSRLSVVARELIALGRGQPQLHGLDVARSPLSPAPAVRTVDDAVAAVSAARTWMWQNAGELTSTHLQLGTQLGLAVHILSSTGDPEMIGGWRQAAIAAADLRATPPVGPARDTAAELTEVLRWLRSLGTGDRGESADRHLPEIARLNAELPFMAATLHKGLSVALQRRDLFVKDEGVLQRPAGSLVFRAAERWRPAVRGDDVVRDLARALLQRQDADIDHVQASRSARTFPNPPRARASMSGPFGFPAEPSSGRDAHRSR